MKTILIIEDNLDVRENIAEILELADYKVLTAQNGKTGIALAKENLPDLIVCDIMMPELDGYGVIHVLSKNPETAVIPFIFLTAKTEKTDIRKGMGMGADDYLTKPFDDVELLDAIEIRLRKNELVRKNSTVSIDSLQQIANQARGFTELENLISDKRRTSKYKKKHTLYSEGSQANNLYFVVSGKVKTFKTNEDARDYIVGLYKAGDFIGYLDLLQNDSYSESAVTLEDSEICIIPKPEFFALLFSNMDIASKFIKMLSSDVREGEERLISLAYNSVRKRVAQSLLRVYANHGDITGMAVSREDLASITGASKETVIRTLSDFKMEGLIQVEGSKISILQEAKLKNLKN